MQKLHCSRAHIIIKEDTKSGRDFQKLLIINQSNRSSYLKLMPLRCCEVWWLDPTNSWANPSTRYHQVSPSNKMIGHTQLTQENKCKFITYRKTMTHIRNKLPNSSSHSLSMTSHFEDSIDQDKRGYEPSNVYNSTSHATQSPVHHSTI